MLFRATGAQEGTRGYNACGKKDDTAGEREKEKERNKRDNWNLTRESYILGEIIGDLLEYLSQYFKKVIW